MLKADE
jgi:FtsP/CotA-like multicopper oxidase with cupredoxin domain